MTKSKNGVATSGFAQLAAIPLVVIKGKFIVIALTKKISYRMQLGISKCWCIPGNHFWIFSGIAEFNEFSESHLWKTLYLSSNCTAQM